jgi:hypothetical protein
MTDVSRVTSPLGPFAAGFADDLSRQGFKLETVGKHVALMAGLSSWLGPRASRRRGCRRRSRSATPPRGARLATATG